MEFRRKKDRNDQEVKERKKIMKRCQNKDKREKLKKQKRLTTNR